MNMNHELENLIDQETIVKFCRFQRLRWSDHVERMSNVMIPKVMTVSDPVEATQRQTEEEVAGLRREGLEKGRKGGGLEAFSEGTQPVEEAKSHGM